MAALKASRKEWRTEMRRVVVTGVAGISPIGNDWDSLQGNL